MRTVGTPGYAAIIASTAAGPLFLLSLTGATLYLRMPEPIPVDPSALLGIAAMLVPAFVIGFVLAFVPNLLGASAMATLAERRDAARAPFAWTAAGALAGTGIAALFADFNDDRSVAFALILTSAACARICRAQLHWEDACFQA